MAKIITAAEAAELIKDNDVIGAATFGAAGVPEIHYHQRHHCHRQRRGVLYGAGGVYRPLALRRLEPLLVGGSPYRLCGHGDPPDHHPPGALPAGGDAPQAPFIKYFVNPVEGLTYFVGSGILTKAIEYASIAFGIKRKELCSSE